VRFSNEESFARELDAHDSLKKHREQFHIPRGTDGREVVYFAGNSLGLQPKSVGPMLEEELNEWATRGVDGHFYGVRPWYGYHEMFRESGARIVGALPGEVVMMNSLTVNLHLMMVSFYRPTPGRYKILIEDPSFPSDLYAVKSQLLSHGYNPDAALLVVRPRPGEHLICMEDVEEIIAREGKQIVLVLLSGVNFVTGQAFDIPRITQAAHAQGCMAGFDLAHAAGNSFANARLGRRFRRVVQLQIPQWRTRRDCRVLRPRTTREKPRPATLRGLVGQRPDHSIPHATQ
jgi:kynureninase